MKIAKKDVWLLAAQVGVWAIILLLLPLAMFISTRDWQSTSTSIIMVWQQLRAPLAVYFVNLSAQFADVHADTFFLEMMGHFIIAAASGAIMGTQEKQLVASMGKS